MDTQVNSASAPDEEMFTTSFRLKRSEWAALQTLAASQHRTASAQLRLLIEQATHTDDDDEIKAAA